MGTFTVALSCLFRVPFKASACDGRAFHRVTFFFTPNNNNNTVTAAPAAQRFSLIHNACIVMMMMNNDKHNTRTRRCGTTLSFSVVIILQVAVCVSVSVGGITASTCGYYIYPGRPVSSIGIID